MSGIKISATSFNNYNKELLFDSNFVNNLIMKVLENINNFNNKNYIKNLNTLKVEYIDLENKSKRHNTHLQGIYSILENKIYIYGEGLINIYENAIASGEYKKKYELELSKVLSHELHHVASTSYSEETGHYITGFHIETEDRVIESNKGLTEAVTEHLNQTMYGNELYGMSYELPLLLVKQLMLITSEELVVNSYFSGVGIKNIKEEMVNISGNKSEVGEIFINFEKHYDKLQMGTNNEIELYQIQNVFINYLFLKLEKGNYTKEETINMLSEFEKYLITNEFLKNETRLKGEFTYISSNIKHYERHKKILLNKLAKEAGLKFT